MGHKFAKVKCQICGKIISPKRIEDGTVRVKYIYGLFQVDDILFFHNECWPTNEVEIFNHVDFDAYDSALEKLNQ